MDQYDKNSTLSGEWIVDGTIDAICLISDIHAAFDDGIFYSMEKKPMSSSFYAIDTSLAASTMTLLWYWILVSLEFLLVPLAWSIFLFLIAKSFEIRISRNACLRISGVQGVYRNQDIYGQGGTESVERYKYWEHQFKETKFQESRPLNPDIFCCGYNEEERLVKQRQPSGLEYAAAYLCLMCSGYEYALKDFDAPKTCNI